MKTSKMTYCLLAALSSLGAAQEKPQETRVEIATAEEAIAMKAGVDEKTEIEIFELGGGKGEISRAIVLAAGPGDEAAADALTGGSAEPAPEDQTVMKIRELAEPILLTIGGDVFDLPSRTGPVAFLGVSAVPMSRELAAHLPLAEDTGLEIEGVSPDSPAEKAGLRKNDVLMKLDDQILIHPRQLGVLVANRKEGDSVRLTYLRKGEAKDVTVTLGKRDATPGAAKGDALSLSFGGAAPLRTFTRRFDLPDGAGELLVQEIESTGEASREHEETTRMDAGIAEEIVKKRIAEEIAKKRIADGKLREEVRRAAEAAYSAEIRRAADGELIRAKAAAAETRKEIDELSRKLDAVMKLLEEKK